MRFRDSWRAMVFAGLAILWPAAAPGHAAGEGHEIKAAFLYNFAKFVEWPEKSMPGETEAFTICVIGEDRMVQAASRLLQDKQVQGRLVVMRALQAPENPRECQILYVDASAAELSERMGSIAKSLPILTVGESERFLRGGGVIHLFVEDGKLRFEISPQAAARAQLKISSKLLKLGRIVEAP